MSVAVPRPERALGGAGLAPTAPPPEVMVGSLNMANGNDRRALLAALSDDGPERRFGELNKSMRDDFTRALKVAMRWALEKQDHRAVNGCTMTMAVLERMNQQDSHLVFKALNPQAGAAVNVVQFVKVIKGVDPEAL